MVQYTEEALVLVIGVSSVYVALVRVVADTQIDGAATDIVHHNRIYQ